MNETKIMIPGKEKGSYTGFLSTTTEIHAFAIGLYDGMRDFHARPGEIPDNEDVKAEPHYYKGAYVIGTIIQFGAVFGFLYSFIPP